MNQVYISSHIHLVNNVSNERRRWDRIILNYFSSVTFRTSRKKNCSKWSPESPGIRWATTSTYLHNYEYVLEIYKRCYNFNKVVKIHNLIILWIYVKIIYCCMNVCNLKYTNNLTKLDKISTTVSCYCITISK